MGIGYTSIQIPPEGSPKEVSNLSKTGVPKRVLFKFGGFGFAFFNKLQFILALVRT